MIWVEKYRPQTIKDLILPDKVKSTFEDYVNNGDFTHLMLTSPSPGTGKTSCAKALCQDLDFDYIVINGSNEGRQIDVLRTSMLNYATTISLNGKPKCIIIDEADHLGPQVQKAFLNFLEEHSDKVRFILTANSTNKLIEPIHSRTTEIKFNTSKADKPMMMATIMKRLMFILTEEKIELKDPKILATLIEKHYPDNRRIINELQRYSSSGVIDVDVLEMLSQDHINELVNALKKKDFNQMRIWVGENMDHDIQGMFKVVYEYMLPLLNPASIPEAVVMMSEYIHKCNFAVDSEIHLVAFFTELMVTVEWK